MIGVTQILDIVHTAQSSFDGAMSIASTAATLLGPADQATLQDELAKLRGENDAGHERLQAKLAQAS